MTQKYHLASTASWLSSIGISHHNLLPYIPLICLSSQQQPLPWDCSTIPKLQLLAAVLSRGPASPVQGMYGCGKDPLILIPFRLLQISCFPLSLRCFSSDSDNCPDGGIGPLLQFPNLLRAGPVLLTLLCFPQFLRPTEFCVIVYILFHWSGAPVLLQLVFCMHFCV